MEELMLKIENVKKEYKLGQIGGTTLRDELQRLWAKIRKKEDPTKRIGAKDYNKGEKFLALDGVSFEVRKGERIGIIGHNGAGKSTLLKLISRITAPTDGAIYLNGRVASMLEVGTGFHPELTGRENVYMNGAILGMTKKEIDAKMEDIIEFSEVRQFIDTPVKRYSSGMYVKLAFSVAAHLDSEIMIMDEVLAVGDMAFQQKCLKKMKDVSNEDGRTILYVSHNMNTIRQLCDRVIVLSKGRVVFDGDVEEGIETYFDMKLTNVVFLDYTERKDLILGGGRDLLVKSAHLLGRDNVLFSRDEKMTLKFEWINKTAIIDLCLRVEVLRQDGTPVGTSFIHKFYSGKSGESGSSVFRFNMKSLAPGRYSTIYTFFYANPYGKNFNLQNVYGMDFEIIRGKEDMIWDARNWGSVELCGLELVKDSID